MLSRKNYNKERLFWKTQQLKPHLGVKVKYLPGLGQQEIPTI